MNNSNVKKTVLHSTAIAGLFVPEVVPRGTKYGQHIRRYRADEIFASGMLEATATTARNAQHYPTTENIDVEYITSADQRKIARTRGRYEYLNNGYVRNAARALATHVIGRRGPKLTIPQNDNVTLEMKEAVEWFWYWWCRQTKFVSKLRRAMEALLYDGEIFFRFVQDPWIRAGGFNLQLISADRVTDEGLTVSDPYRLDGIEYDVYGHPVKYWIKPSYPNPDFNGFIDPPEPVNARHMLHMANLELAEQTRGLPIVHTIQEHLANSRRWQNYTMDAAERAARFSGALKTDLPPDTESGDEEDYTGQSLEVRANEFLVLPGGYELQQMDAKYPTSTYSDYDNKNLERSSAGIGVPDGYIRCCTKDYNYSSWRGEKVTYWEYIGTLQEEFEITLADAVLEACISFNATLSPILAELYKFYRGELWQMDKKWQWPQPESIDPKHDAEADEINLRNGVTSRERIAARRGEEIEEIDEERKADNVVAMGDFMEDVREYMAPPEVKPL